MKRAACFAAWVLGAGLCGCTVGPAYHPLAPPTPAAPQYKESPVNFQDADGWKVADPQDAMLRGKWWEIFDQPELDALEDRLDIDNQNLKQYFEDFMEARALVAEARAKYWPVVTAGGGVTRSGPAKPGGSDLWSIPVDVSWEPDLWGTIRNQVRVAEFGAQADAANLESEKLTEEAALAEYFFEIRGQDALQQLLDQTVDDDRQELQLTQSLFQAGVGDQAAVLQSGALLQSDRAQAAGLALARALYEHAMAVLVGAIPTDFSIPVLPALYRPPPIPTGLPSQLLERRPDIAAAERTLAQANATIGIGYGAFYPQLTLSADGGLQSLALKTLFDAASRFWSVGPNLSQTVYNGGLYRAQIRQFTAAYNADQAAYRQTVLLAFQQVEDGLAAVRIDSDQIREEQSAVVNAQASLDLELARYRAGIDPYLDVLVAKTTLLQAEENILAYQVSSMTAAVQLVQALGGGWDASQLPSPAAVTHIPPDPPTGH